MLRILLCLLLVTAGFSQDSTETCEKDDGDCISNNPWEKTSIGEIDDADCPVAEMQATLKNDEEATVEIETAKLLIDTLKWPEPIPNYGTPLCYKKSGIYYVPSRIWYRRGWCYVHWYFRRLRIPYAHCQRGRCRNLPCSHIFYTHYCYPANYQSIKIWMFCPHLKPRYWWPHYSRLPMCCECRRSGFPWLQAAPMSQAKQAP